MLAQPSPDLLSLNTATVRAQWTLAQIIEGCARHQIRGISPWRDQVAQLGLKETARRIRDAGLQVSGHCRGGMFPAAGSRRPAGRGGRQPASGGRGRRTRSSLPGYGGWRTAQRAGRQTGIEGHRRRAADGARWIGRIARVCARVGACRWPLSRCTRCTPATGPA